MFKVFNKFQNPKKVFQGELDWVAQTSIKFKSQLNLKCKLN